MAEQLLGMLVLLERQVECIVAQYPACLIERINSLVVIARMLNQLTVDPL